MRVTVKKAAHYGGYKFFEVLVMAGGRPFPLDVPLTTLSRFGVCKSLAATKKAYTWLNSPDGIRWVTHQLGVTDHWICTDRLSPYLDMTCKLDDTDNLALAADDPGHMVTVTYSNNDALMMQARRFLKSHQQLQPKNLT